MCERERVRECLQNCVLVEDTGCYNNHHRPRNPHAHWQWLLQGPHEALVGYRQVVSVNSLVLVVVADVLPHAAPH